MKAMATSAFPLFCIYFTPVAVPLAIRWLHSRFSFPFKTNKQTMCTNTHPEAHTLHPAPYTLRPCTLKDSEPMESESGKHIMIMVLATAAEWQGHESYTKKIKSQVKVLC
jgi:hypothetical protein